MLDLPQHVCRRGEGKDAAQVRAHVSPRVRRRVAPDAVELPAVPGLHRGAAAESGGGGWWRCSLSSNWASAHFGACLLSGNEKSQEELLPCLCPIVVVADNGEFCPQSEDSHLL